jgi:hypothetical protein
MNRTVLFFNLVFGFLVSAQAEWRLGANIGFGGTGISTVSTINDIEIEVMVRWVIVYRLNTPCQKIQRSV